jgi:N-terminal domain of reverse transcriptase
MIDAAGVRHVINRRGQKAGVALIRKSAQMRLQARIVRATQAGRWGKVKALQHLLTHSFNAKIPQIDLGDAESQWRI